MYKAFKFRLYPDNKQKELINKTFGCSRFVYNFYLNKIKDSKYINAYNNLKYTYLFLQEVDSTIIRKSIFHLDDNIKHYYNDNFGYPKYKSKYDRNSYSTNTTFSEILRQIQYKSKYKNKYFYQIDEYYPSSQECNMRGNIDKKYKDINERTYICTKCHHKQDRDLNASINIMFEGLKLYMKEVL